MLTDLLRRLTNYSVALARMAGDDTSTFELLGSGTLVHRGKRFGILTAHHVLYGNKRPVVLGSRGTDRIIIVIQQSRTVEIAARDPSAVPRQ